MPAPAVILNGPAPAGEAQLVVLSQSGDKLHLEASSDAKVLLMAGEPLNEPIVGYGPFVMKACLLRSGTARSGDR